MLGQSNKWIRKNHHRLMGSYSNYFIKRKIYRRSLNVNSSSPFSRVAFRLIVDVPLHALASSSMAR